MSFRIEKAVTIGLCILWAILIFTDYWYFHPEYKTSFQVFQYLDLTIALGILGGITGLGLYLTRNNPKPIFLANGLGVIALLLVICGLTIYFHFFKVGGNFTINIGEIFTYLSKVIAVLAAIYFIFTTTFALGDLLLKKLFSFSFNKGEQLLVKTAIGVTFISILLFLLGTFNLLNIKIILPIFIFLLGINWRGSWQFVQTTLIKPSPYVQELNWLGFGSFYILLIFIALIFLQNIRPYPFGFDALVLYLNLPNLINENQGLITGFSPYYWSLFITLGYILFDQIEVVIALSVTGGILSILFIYEICRKWLDVNYSMLVATLFYSLPMINYQSYRDIKTDLGLLFILLAVVLVLIKWLSLEDETAYNSGKLYLSKENRKKAGTEDKEQSIPLAETIITQSGILKKYLSESTQLIILIGLFSGMAIGIKLTGLILIFSILGVFAYIKGGNMGFLTAFVSSFAIVLLGDLEVATGLRAYHFGANNLKTLFSIISIAGLGYLFLYKRTQLLELIKIAVVYIFFTGLTYLPWPLKNYQETNSLSINTFITGKPSNRVMDFSRVIRNAKEIKANIVAPSETIEEVEDNK